MKINNPTKFFQADETNPLYSSIKNSATIMTRGDVIKKYAVTDSNLEQNWHFTEDASNDSWVKYSFDAGRTWPLKFKYKNSLLLKYIKEGMPSANEALTFDFSNYSDIDYTTIRNGRISVYALSNDGFTTSLPCYRYKFDDANKILTVILTMDPPSDTIKSMLMVELDGHMAMALAVKTPVYSSTIGFSSYEYNQDLGVYAFNFDSYDSTFTSTTNLSNVSRIKLKVVSGDPNVTGTIGLTISCGSFEETFAINVTDEEAWQVIDLDSPLNGVLIMKRSAEGDTLKSNGSLVTCILTNIQVQEF